MGVVGSAGGGAGGGALTAPPPAQAAVAVAAQRLARLHQPARRVDVELGTER